MVNFFRASTVFLKATRSNKNLFQLQTVSKIFSTIEAIIYTVCTVDNDMKIVSSIEVLLHIALQVDWIGGKNQIDAANAAGVKRVIWVCCL